MSLFPATKTILSLCDLSGNWSKPYELAGYRVIRVDLQAGQDVRLLPFPGEVHGILAAPPCTVFASSGARWPRTESEMLEGLSVVHACLGLISVTQPKFWALENPVGKLSRWLGPPALRFQPSDYGDTYTKQTLLWGRFVAPPKHPTTPTEGSKMHTQYGGKSMRTKNARSATPMGFARAFFEANP